MPDLAAAYAETRRRMCDLVRESSADDLERIVPACPEWTVRDLLAHVTSIATSLASGAFPPDLNPVLFWDEQMAARREAFVDDGVAALRDRSVDEIVATWNEAAEAAEAMIRGERPWPSWPEGGAPLPAWVLVTDLSVHHHDLRGALQAPGDRDSLATGLGLRSYVEGMRLRASIEQIPAFRIVAGARSWTIGEGEPTATVTADPFELARAASGRRSPEQVRAFDWGGADPEPFLACFFPYGIREDALVE